MRILGVDPGGTGALALLSSDLVVVDMPVFRVTRGKGQKAEIDVHGLLDILGRWRPEVCWFELVGGVTGQSASAAFNFGRLVGLCEGLVRTSGARFETVPPAKWKRAMGLRGGKDDSRALATRLWPSNAGDFRRVKDDGRAEAALIAEYGRRQLSGLATDKGIFD